MKKTAINILIVLCAASCAHRESKADEASSTYSWTPGFTSNGATANVQGGTYNVTATDAQGAAASANEPVSATESASQDFLNSSIPRPTEQKLIKNGEINFRVKNLRETRANIQKSVTAAGGYVSSESSSGYEDNPSEQVVVRVPAAKFDKVLEEILNGAESVDSKNVTIQDVTEEYVDIEARLKNKKQLEERYQALLAKATKVEDMLAIEREISLIRQEIEASEGRMRYLNNRVGFSTITLNYYEKKISGFNFGGKLANGMANGGEGFLYFIIGICSMWPLWLMTAVIWILIVRWIRKRRKRKALQGS